MRRYNNLESKTQAQGFRHILKSLTNWRVPEIIRKGLSHIKFSRFDENKCHQKGLKVVLAITGNSDKWPMFQQRFYLFNFHKTLKSLDNSDIFVALIHL